MSSDKGKTVARKTSTKGPAPLSSSKGLSRSANVSLTRRDVVANPGSVGPPPVETPAERWERLQKVERYNLMAPADKQRYVQDLLITCRGFHQETLRQGKELDELRRRMADMDSERSQLDMSLRAQHAVTRTYEHFGFVPSSLNSDMLRSQIASIENDIRSYELVTDYPQNLLMPALADDERGRLWQLLELKFQRLELLITVLRKRLLKFEENEHMALVVKEFGNVQALLEENRRLSANNIKLRSREQRFACEPLLNRDLGRADSTFLRVLCMALQNELSEHRRLVDKYNLKQNPSMQMLVLPPDKLADQTSLADLDTWLLDDSLRNDFTEELDTWRKANEGHAPPPGFDDLDRQQLIQVINNKEQDKLLLQRQIDRLLEERRAIANVAVMRDYCDQEFKHPLKGLAKKQFQDLNEKLLEELKDAHDKLKQAEDSLAMQAAIFEDSTKKKARYIDENMILGRRVLRLLSQNHNLTSRLEKATHVGHTLYVANLSTIHAVLEDKFVPAERERFIKHLHGDILREYLRQYRALLQLQSWARGMAVRKRLQSMRGFKASEAFMTFRRPGPRPHEEAEDEPEEAEEDKQQDALLPVMRTLAEVILHAQRDVVAILDVPKVLRICRREVKDQLLPKLADELAQWKDYVQSQFTRLNETMAVALKPKEVQDFAMQTSPMGVTVDTQTEQEPDEHDSKRKRSGKATSARGASAAGGTPKEEKKKSKKKSRA